MGLGVLSLVNIKFAEVNADHHAGRNIYLTPLRKKSLRPKPRPLFEVQTLCGAGYLRHLYKQKLSSRCRIIPGEAHYCLRVSDQQTE